eukprot:scaffold634_cov185-Ochromonas_danica.AAC.15
MSTDLNINRPSSRVTRAPGGASTISFGSEEPPKPPAVANSPVKPKQETVTPPPVPETPAKVTKAAVKGKVVVLVAGNVEPDFYVEAVVKALAVEGIKGAVVSKIPDVGALAYAAQTLAKSADVVIAGAILSDFHADQVATLNNALLQAGLNNKPIIPAFIARPSLLEAKVALADTASEWAQSVVTVLSLKNLETAPAPEVVIKEKPVLTPTVTSVDTLLDIFRESLRARGASGIFGLSRKFKIIDDNNNGQLDLKEFTKAIGEHALGWSAAQIKAVFDFFDKDKSGSISFDEFLVGVRGGLNERRKNLVLLAFNILDSDKSGIVELNDIQAKYDASKHPDVISGKRTNDEVLREFLDTFDTEEKDGKVTPSEFITYYANVSSSIDNDDYFELMIRNAWHISGGEGWCANSSNRRVLVTHADGHQSVEEIKNDIGIKDDDKEAILANLKEQGIDVDVVELSNGTKIKANEPAPPAPVKANPQETPLGRPAASFNPRRQPGGVSTFTLG